MSKIITKSRECYKEQSLDSSGGVGEGNGNDLHGIAGQYSGNVFRDMLRFETIPWDDWDGSHVYQIFDAWIEFYTDTHNLADNGGSARMEGQRISGGSSWSESGGSEGNWTTTPGGNSVYPGATPAGTTFDSGAGNISSSDGHLFRLYVREYVEAIAPSRVLKKSGSAGDAQSNQGVIVRSTNEASTAARVVFSSRRVDAKSKRPRLFVKFDSDQPPSPPEVITPETTSSRSDAAVQVATANGRELTVEFNFNDPDDQLIGTNELKAVADAVTDATLSAATPYATTGRVVPTATGTARRYSQKLTGLPARTTLRYAHRVIDPSGAYSPWTSVDNGRIVTAYLPGAPLQRTMTTNPDAVTVSGTINSQDPGDYVRQMAIEVLRSNPDGTTSVIVQATQDLGDVPGLRRPSVAFGSLAGVNGGDVLKVRQKHQNRDLVEGPWSAYDTVTMVTQVGPTITPADVTTKLLSRGGPFTITAPSFDGYQYRLYRGDTQIYDSGLITLVAVTSVAVTIPSGLLNWGDTIGIEAATRPAATTSLGDFCPRSFIYINALPTTTLSASDGHGSTGTVVPTLDVEWYAPYQGADVGNYGEVPVAQELELRVAASPQGSGTLAFRRYNQYPQSPERQRTGRLLDLMQTTTGTSSDASVTTATYSATNASGYSGNSLEVQATGASSTDRGTRKTLSTGAQDLSVFGGQAFVRIWRRCTSVTNLVRWVMRVEFASATDYAEFSLFESTDTINTWAEVAVHKNNPRATSGTVNWALFSGVVRIFADVSAAYTGNIELRDLRIGVTQTAKATPDGYLVPEASYDARVRYRDNATPKLTTAVSSTVAAGTVIKVDDVTGAVVGDWITVEQTGSVGIYAETRQITAVGTAGAGGTGITVSEAFGGGEPVGWPVDIYYWGPWTPWLTRKVSVPPVVTASTPADAATVTDPTPDLVHTYSSAGAKVQASHTVRVYLVAADGDQLLYQRTTNDAGLTDTLPTLLLANATVYAWTVTGTDTDGLSGTTTRRTFTTAFTTPAAVTNLAATTDDAAGSITLTWDASLAADLDHYRVYWVGQDGQRVRIDGGPVEVDDGRTKLTVPTFTSYEGRLGTDTLIVTVHDGSLESDTASVDVDLGGMRPGSWEINSDGEERYAFPFDPDSMPRTHTGMVETYSPPGRPFPLHLHWGTGGRIVNLSMAYLPTEDGDLSQIWHELLDTGTSISVKAVEGYTWDVMRCRVASVSDEPRAGGVMSVSVELHEVARDGT